LSASPLPAGAAQAPRCQFGSQSDRSHRTPFFEPVSYRIKRPTSDDDEEDQPAPRRQRVSVSDTDTQGAMAEEAAADSEEKSATGSDEESANPSGDVFVNKFVDLPRIEAKLAEINIVSSRLFDTRVGRDEMLQDITKICPKISLQNPLIVAFVAKIQKRISSQAGNLTNIPLKVENPTTWPTIGSNVDEWWQGPDGVATLEPILSNPPPWLAMEKRLLVKARGSFDAPLMVISR
jgi:hypothetical protein